MSEPDPRERGVPWNTRTVRAVLASTALAPLGVPLIAPGIAPIRDEFAISNARASLLISAYFVVGIVLSPFIGLLIDRIGRRRMLAAGLTTFGAFGTAMAFAPSFDVVLALRVLQGTGAATIFISTVTIITDTFEDAQRNTVLGVNVAVLSAAAAIFPVIGGLLVELAWNAPFLAYAAAFPVAAFVLIGVDEPVRSAPDRGLEYVRSAIDVVVEPVVLSLFGATILTEFLAFGVVFTTVPIVLARSISPVWIGVTLFGAETVATLVAAGSGRLARGLANLHIIALGFACYALGFFGIWAAPAPLFVAMALLVVGAGLGLLLPTVDAAIGARIDSAHRAGAFSVRNSATFFGRAAGPITFVGLAETDLVGFDPLLLAAGIVALAAAVLAWRAAE
ncbi:major facilitator superfamily protein [Salinarchaeum sp. Harcht-Bsk1]|uniref:MFS transporter n=1 Tax=Salinarchaeum sp. Harcht-Bsk1 TaxID=1333523 RepID=UPI0003423892|nr:MFS transporter [Salinarchaeum sp. Harcht-Bsk1]AGN02927.1 major facilitator superfamily protein [Salinarchaeum sp. Harcht-Bsk1]